MVDETLTLDRVAARPDSISEAACWVCGGRDLRLVKRGNLTDALSADVFRITDAGYGQTADIYACDACGFRQCARLPDVLPFYVEMDDLEYETTRAQRMLQARRLLATVQRFKMGGRLLDIGAGSGILVGEAVHAGFQAEGVEPSRALQERAREIGLTVHLGVLPCAAAQGPFDVVTVVDVIEHVADPVGLLKQAVQVMAPDGVCMIVTPDVRSLSARLMGWRWWHYRIAHIGYFDRKTLAEAAAAAGLRVELMARPKWYFPASYLLKRAMSYVPGLRGLEVPRLLDRVTVPLNLFDSLLVICRKSGNTSQVR